MSFLTRAQYHSTFRNGTQEILLIESGLVKVTQLDASGTEVIVGIAGPGNIAGDSRPRIAPKNGRSAK